MSVIKSLRPDVEVPDVALPAFVLERMASFGDKPAIIEGKSGRTITYAELPKLIYRAANGLLAKGFKQGDVLGIHMPNLPEYAVAFHGCALIGGTLTTSNPLYGARELEHQLRDAKARFLLTVPPFLEVCKEAAAAAGVEEVFVLGDAACFLNCEDDSKPAEVTVDPAKDLVVIPYSSGTSGLPKGVMLTHTNIVANLQQLTADPEHHVDIGTEDVVIAVLPFFHIYGMVLILNSVLRTGSTVVTMPKFDPAEFLTNIQTHKVTWAPLVPPLVLFLAKHPVVEKFDLSSLRVLFCGAAPLDGELTEAASKRLGTVVRQGYGMTEMSPASHISVPGVDVPGSCGRLVCNCEAKVVDPDSGALMGPKTAESDNRGELWVRGPNIMQGYLNNAEATAATIDADGFLHTGDVATYDEAGNFFIVDRLKELIKVKGFQVAPAELEGLLLEHADINDAAVIGVPDERSGEAVKAFVVRKPEATLTEEDVKGFIAAKVAAFKAISHVEFIEAVPKSASGKILKRVLREKEAAKAKAAEGEAGGAGAGSA